MVNLDYTFHWLKCWPCLNNHRIMLNDVSNTLYISYVMHGTCIDFNTARYSQFPSSGVFWEILKSTEIFRTHYFSLLSPSGKDCYIVILITDRCSYMLLCYINHNYVENLRLNVTIAIIWWQECRNGYEKTNLTKISVQFFS